MSSVLLIYPYFRPFPDLSIFRQPPLGLCYVASSLRQAGHDVHLLDCTFLKRAEALPKALQVRADVIGIYCMVSMEADALRLARQLRGRCGLLVAGGPLPTCSPELFLGDFDVVVRGEGERTMVELVRAYEAGTAFGTVSGLALPGGDAVTLTPERTMARDLDRLPFPARDLLPNERYIRHGKRKYGYSITTVMSTRGCPYRCEFCSNVIFGGSYRERSAESIVDEIEEALALGYDRIAFADDVFTLSRARVRRVCREIARRRLRFAWECLGRVDSIDEATAAEMKSAGCARIFFGIESGSDATLKLMNKQASARQAWDAVHAAHRAGLSVGAFFILFYPGETDESVLETLRFATSLPLDYLGLTMPYPLPGTALFSRVRQRGAAHKSLRERPLRHHALTFDSDFSEAKMWAGILKGTVQFVIRKRLGKLAAPVLKLIEKPSDLLLRIMR